MAHDHGLDNERRLAGALLLTSSFMFVEIAAGYFANSLTLLADAGHMFLDSSALALSWYAMRLARRDSDHTLSYGYHRFQVLAAFINALLMVGLVAWILIEAASRLMTPEPILPLPALAVGIIGLGVNLVALKMLHGSESLNMRSAALHVLGDILGSVGAIVAAGAVLLFNWLYADPALAVVIAAILARGAWRVLRESAHILLEGVPPDINLEDIRNTVTDSVTGVQEVHHVHAWALTDQKPLLTLHATVSEDEEHHIINRIKSVLLHKFGIDHSTIQIERGDCPDDEPADDEPADGQAHGAGHGHRH